MATNTYIALASVTASGSSSVLVMDSIPQTYTDLVLVAQYLKSGTGSSRLIFNNNATSGLYSQTVVYGNGTSVSSGRDSGNYFYLMDYLQSSTSNPNMAVAHIMNYSNTTTYKTILERSGVSDKGTVVGVGLWRNTAAVTRIDIADASNFAAGTTFSLYGIRAEGVSPAAKATGGAIYSDSTYYYHVFGSTGTFTPLQSLSADILVVAGGGGGGSGRSGSHYAGGGGAGGLRTFTSQSLSATNYTCTVGGGGTGGPTQTTTNGTNGGNSQFGSLTATTGGGGGGSDSNAGLSGGSGGGAGGSQSGTQAGGAGVSGEGNNGGAKGSAYQAGGGGGAGAVGANGSSSNAGGGNGGIGATSSFITAIVNATGVGQLVSSSGYFAGGGGGSPANGTANGIGGYGGGGNASDHSTATQSGILGTGGGGGGGAAAAGLAGVGGNGGAGSIIIRYTKA